MQRKPLSPLHHMSEKRGRKKSSQEHHLVIIRAEQDPACRARDDFLKQPASYTPCDG